MRPRVTAALATVWLTVAVLVGGAVTLHLPRDQYSPASPRRYAGIQRELHAGDWDRDFAEDQPFDLWIGSPILSKGWRRLSNIVGAELASDKVDYGDEMPETFSRAVFPSDLSDDPFVADDTFQDQGPGSMEIYKLDLSREKTLLTATTPTPPSRSKSKPPKKTSHLSSNKTKTAEVKSTITSENVGRRQSNLFEEPTESASVNRDTFGVGGVPELQVGCEGLEASHKARRSIDTLDREKGEVPASLMLDVTPVSLDLDDVLSYDEEEYEEMDELLKLKRLETTTKDGRPSRGDMDASHLNSEHLDEFRRPEKLPVRGDLGKSTQASSAEQALKRSPTDLEAGNREIKSKREAPPLADDGIHSRRLLWLAEANTEGSAERARQHTIDWGFGEDEGVVSSDELQTVTERRRQHEMRYHQDTSRRRDQHRESNTDVGREYERLLEQRRRAEEERSQRVQQASRRAPSKWEENEEEKRRDEMRRKQYEEYRKRMYRTSTPRADDDEEAQRRQIEERQRLEAAREMARRHEEEMRRREEEERRRRLREEQMRRRPQNNWEDSRGQDLKTPSTTDDEKRRRIEEEERRRRLQEQEEEERRREQHRQEARRREEEEERRRQKDAVKNLSEEDRRRLEDRRREWSEKRRQEQENERRRQQAPSSLMQTERPAGYPSDVRRSDRDEQERRQEKEKKLREYVARNQPVSVNRSDRRPEEERRYRPDDNRDPRVDANRNDEEYRRRTEEQRKRQEEERKLQDYIRRNQPVHVPKANQSTAANRDWVEEWRIEQARRRGGYSDPGARRAHGPSAPTYIDPRGSPEDVRRGREETRRLEEERWRRYEAEKRRKELARRQREEEEEERLRKEAARREEEVRRAQSRRYEEDRKRLEAARAEAERRRQETRSRDKTRRTWQPETTGPIYRQDPRVLAEHKRRQDSRPISSDSTRVVPARERQRLEIERRQQEENKKESGRKETDQWRRHELARLNSLPVNARIIVRPGSSPSVFSRGGFNEIDFTGINPHRDGVQVPQFPARPTSRPPVETPSPCVWAVVHCCSSNSNRLVKCFESLGCPGTNWDPEPCRGSVMQAARAEVLKFYANA
ncbi:hypothetical protein PUN28_008605 [Cardiocondyla obscurior]|uniref:Trichohyalin n=1 Tax=Cardiocondyla obscurior TaxID=286306 RepID=A0AAW2G4D4_9HYME